MVMIPRAFLGRVNSPLETDTTPGVAVWERQRECIKADPDLFDVDATRDMHVEGKLKFCDKCRVKTECMRDRMINQPGSAGLYAGMIYTQHVGEAPYTIDDYHASHRVGSAFRRENPRFPPGWTQERTCASRDIGCTEVFTVTPRNHGKKFHSTSCRRRYYQVVGPEIEDVA